MRRLIVTADDFGLSPQVNAAVEQAHRHGVLTAASLMVGEAAARQAVAIARRNPRLAIGLHLTLTDGIPVLPPERIPALVQANGRLRDDMPGIGLTLAVSPAARAQLRAEIAAQFAAFAATGLACDHVNAHRHFHLHPIIAVEAFRAARAAGVRATRIPWEPPALIRAADPATARTQPRALAPFAALLRRLAARFGLSAADRVIGLAWSGAFTAERLAAVLPLLPGGSTEIYLHPATRDGFSGAAPGYRHAAELAALTDPRVRRAVAEGRFRTGGYLATS